MAAGGTARGAGAVLAAAVLWGTTGTANHYRPAAASALSVGAARIAAGGLLLLAWAQLRGELRPLAAAAGRDRRRAALLLAGGAAVAAYQLSFFTAVSRTGVAVGTVVAIGTAPVLTGLLARAAHGAPLTAGWLASTVVAVAGCAVLALGGEDTGVDPLGIALAVLAGLSYAAYAVAASTLITGGAASGAVMAALFGVGGALLLPVLAAGTPGWLLTARGAAVAGHLALLTTFGAYLLYGRGLRVTPVATAATLSLAEPAAAALLGLLLLGEPAGTATWTGLGLLAAALLVLTAATARRPARPAHRRARRAGRPPR